MRQKGQRLLYSIRGHLILIWSIRSWLWFTNWDFFFKKSYICMIIGRRRWDWQSTSWAAATWQHLRIPKHWVMQAGQPPASWVVGRVTVTTLSLRSFRYFHAISNTCTAIIMLAAEFILKFIASSLAALHLFEDHSWSQCIQIFQQYCSWPTGAQQH